MADSAHDSFRALASYRALVSSNSSVGTSPGGCNVQYIKNRKSEALKRGTGHTGSAEVGILRIEQGGGSSA